MLLRIADEGFSIDVTSDLIVIGVGPGICNRNPSGATGLKTAIVERSHLGGICLNWGDIPTKALNSTAASRISKNSVPSPPSLGNGSWNVRSHPVWAVFERTRYIAWFDRKCDMPAAKPVWILLVEDHPIFHTESFNGKKMQTDDSPQNEITMESQLSEIPKIIEKLQTDPELFSRIQRRESAFLIAMREVLSNAVSHGNRNDPSKKVYIRYSCEADGALSILIRDEGEGFNPKDVLTPKNIGADLGRGISLMKSYMDEVQFRKNGTEVYMSMQSRAAISRLHEREILS